MRHLRLLVCCSTAVILLVLIVRVREWLRARQDRSCRWFVSDFTISLPVSVIAFQGTAQSSIRSPLPRRSMFI